MIKAAFLHAGVLADLLHANVSVAAAYISLSALLSSLSFASLACPMRCLKLTGRSNLYSAHESLSRTNSAPFHIADSVDSRSSAGPCRAMRAPGVPGVRGKQWSYRARGWRAKAPGRGKLSIIKDGAVELHGLDDFRQDIHAVSHVMREFRQSVPDAHQHCGAEYVPWQENQTPG